MAKEVYNLVETGQSIKRRQLVGKRLGRFDGAELASLGPDLAAPEPSSDQSLRLLSAAQNNPRLIRERVLGGGALLKGTDIKGSLQIRTYGQSI